jgi:hypothetical protein
MGHRTDDANAGSHTQPERREEGGSSASEASLVLREEHHQTGEMAVNGRLNKHLKNMIDGLIARDCSTSTSRGLCASQGPVPGLAALPPVSGDLLASLASLGIDQTVGSASAIDTPAIDPSVVRPLNILPSDRLTGSSDAIKS